MPDFGDLVNVGVSCNPAGANGGADAFGAWCNWGGPVAAGVYRLTLTAEAAGAIDPPSFAVVCADTNNNAFCGDEAGDGQAMDDDGVTGPGGSLGDAGDIGVLTVEATPTPTPTPTLGPGETPTAPPSLTPTPTPGGTRASPTPTPALGPVLAQGDNDCDGDTDAVDALAALRHVAGLGVNQEAGCPALGGAIPAGAAPDVFGDVDCDGDVDSVDGLKVLRFVAGLAVTQNEPCVDIGESLG